MRRRLGSPVLFRQERPGQGRAVFELLKFRTMLEPDPANAAWSPTRERMTPFGSLAALDQPRRAADAVERAQGGHEPGRSAAAAGAYLDRYSPEQRRRHEVRPGITGLAQVSGRNAITWDEKFALDVEYVEHRSLRLDLTILLRTVGKVLRRDGISETGGVTMTEFDGTGERLMAERSVMVGAGGFGREVR